MSDINNVTDPVKMHQERNARADKILIRGIIALFLSWTFFLSLIGLGLGIANFIISSKFISETGPIFLKARIGKYLSIGAIALGAVLGCYSFLVLIGLAGTMIRNIN